MEENIVLEKKIENEELDNIKEKQDENNENKVSENLNPQNTEISSENFKLEVRNLPRSFGFGV
jgi:hypothetical protein